MKPIHKKRLRKLIAFLRTLPRKRFDFAIIRNEPPKCGAVGCAIGYTPNVFPRAFKSVLVEDYDSTHAVAFRGEQFPSFNRVAVWLTGLEDNWTAASLFEPSNQQNVDERLPVLSENATPKQVAAMLEKFIKLQEQDAAQAKKK